MLLLHGQLLYSKLRPYLNKVLIADDDGYCTSEILPLEFENIVFPPYARHVLMSAYFLGYANQCSYGVKIVKAIEASMNPLNAIMESLS